MDTKVLKINKEDIIYNFNVLKNEIKKDIIAVIKGDGYGFGLINMAKILSQCDVSYFAVSEANEAINLRLNNIEKPVLLLTPQNDPLILEELIKNDITLTVASYHDAKLIREICEKLNKKAKAHIKVDTGFGRFGFLYDNKEEIIRALRVENIEYEGIFSHFSCSFEKKYKITQNQFKKYCEIISYLSEYNFNFRIKHIANSCAAIRFPETRLDAVRLGSALIGRLPLSNTLGLKKIGYLESYVLTLNKLPKGHNVSYANVYTTNKETDTAVVPVGYKDGFMVEKKEDTFRIKDILRYILNDIRSYNKKNYAYINGKKARLIGRVGLYNVVLDVTGMDINIGDKVIFQINPLMIDSGIKREII